MNDSERAAALEDPRMLPPWHIVVFGASIAVTLMLVRVHLSFLLVAFVSLLVLELVARRRGAYAIDANTKKLIGMRGPLPRIWATALGPISLVVVATNVMTGTLVPPSMVPWWALVVIAVVVGIAMGLFLRWSENVRIVWTQRLEREASPHASTSDTTTSEPT